MRIYKIKIRFFIISTSKELINKYHVVFISNSALMYDDSFGYKDIIEDSYMLNFLIQKYEL